MIKAVLFDLDGTLLDTTQDIASALECALDVHFTEDQVKSFIGNGLRNAIKSAMLFLNMNASESNIDFYKKKLDIAYNKVPVKYTKPYPKVIEVLKNLQERGIYLGVFSNKDHNLVNIILDTCLPEINFCFKAGWGSSYKVKPSSDAVLGFCKMLNINIEELLYIGDSEVDYKTAINSNVDYRILTSGQRTVDILLKNNVPKDKMIDTLDSILPLFKNS